MKLANSGARIFVPDGSTPEEALGRTTHMGIVAHQDDLEIAAYHGILQCYEDDRKHFFGVVITDGRGSPREGEYASLSDEEIRRIRMEEQMEAAVIGKYSGLALLDYRSERARDTGDEGPDTDLETLISAATPETMYTHNLFDKHDTHLAVALRVITTLRRLPARLHPARLYGAEVWRGLEWLPGKDRVALDVSARPELAAELIRAHDSQISAGKRLDLATAGRRLANATYADAHSVDRAEALIYALEMIPLIQDRSLEIDTFMQQIIARFSAETIEAYRKLSSQ
ncbi:MAG: PIG-L family deacetylase [Firmicutes bacterium]|nr:PIG-L family deacetylase [Bacillota bacterium]